MKKRQKATPPNLLLLTPELRKKVEARIEECYVIAEKHFKRKFPRPEVRYDIKNRFGGTATYATNLIRLNLILLVENEEHFLKQTVAHEVAHLINHLTAERKNGKRLMPHGKEWKAVMTEVYKLPPHTKHTYDCTSIQMSARRRRRSTVARVDRALQTIGNVLRRVETRFTETERAKFYAGLHLDNYKAAA